MRCTVTCNDAVGVGLMELQGTATDWIVSYAISYAPGQWGEFRAARRIWDSCGAVRAADAVGFMIPLAGKHATASQVTPSGDRPVA